MASYDDGGGGPGGRSRRIEGGRSRPVQGLAGRRARVDRRGAAVISILVAAAVGLAFTLLGTPVAIRAFRIWGWGQRIREDGPHTHFEKVGTPTMGGIVMLGGARRRLPRLAVHAGRGGDVQSRGARPDPRRARIRGRGVHRRLPEDPPQTVPRACRSCRSSPGRRSSRCSSRVVVVRVLGRDRHVDEPVVPPADGAEARRALLPLGVRDAHVLLERREPHRRARRPRRGFDDPRRSRRTCSSRSGSSATRAPSWRRSPTGSRARATAWTSTRCRTRRSSRRR